MHEQYKPASAPLAEPTSSTTHPAPHSSVVAVLLGGVGACAGTLALIVALYNVAESGRFKQGVFGVSSLNAFTTALWAGTGLINGLGGYLAAAWARHSSLRHALGAGLVFSA
jgi:hypothetical protein